MESLERFDSFISGTELFQRTENLFWTKAIEMTYQGANNLTLDSKNVASKLT